MQDDGPFSPSADAAGRRALGNRVLALLASRKDAQAAPMAINQLNTASNMTNELSALITLTQLGGRRVDQSLENFYEKWKESPLVIDKWFAVCASRGGQNAITNVQSLIDHPAYKGANPNRVRALLGNFAMNNPEGFHRHDGSGYAFFADQVSKMDDRNPQVAARLLGAFDVWPRLENNLQIQIKEQLKNVIASKPSKNVLEIASRILG